MKLQTNRTGRLIPNPGLIHPVYANPPYGIFSRVAREVGVSPSFARKVALKIHTSKRVAAVLIREGNRVQAELAASTKRSRKVAA